MHGVGLGCCALCNVVKSSGYVGKSEGFYGGIMSIPGLSHALYNGVNNPLAREKIVEVLDSGQREPAPPLPQGSVDAEAVPEAVRPQPVPLIRILMPLVMVGAMLGMVALMVLGAGPERRVSPMSLMFPLMMLASVFMMFNPQGGDQNPDETRRTYLRHLKALREKVLELSAAQRAHEEHRNPAPEQVAALVGSYRMWERVADDPDALEVRVGTGPMALCVPINVPDSGATEDLDPVCAVSVRHTVNALRTLAEMPVVIQLQAFTCLGLSGERAADVARAMLLHLAVAHGPETVGIELHPRCNTEWEWVKWLPHTRGPEQARFRIVLVDATLIPAHADLPEDDEVTSYLCVGVQRHTPLGQRAEKDGIFLVAGEDLQVVTAAGDEVLGVPDDVDAETALLVARQLAQYRRPDLRGAVRSRRRSNDLMDLVGCGDIDELAASGMWAGRQAEQRLKVPIGLDEVGQPVYLDLKESAQGGMGPHGLCIGATGSGKSELLRTLVASLAATHSPKELNLVLVDFKGGATFLGCDKLPHTSAVITNLEEESTLVERMHDAISGEMNRRQELLRAAGNFANVDAFNAALSAVEEFGRIPALVIVVDEFSELLGQHPDFAELFVAVGRLGRSLHVHLLLASQRLEEGRLRGLDSHLSYRIGLKTFSAAESRQVLGVTDAYHLPAQPGAGYLKTDADAPTCFQAAYVSGPVERRVAAPESQGTADSAGRMQQTRPRVTFFSGWAPAQDEDIDTHAVAAQHTVVDESQSLLDALVAAAELEARRRQQHAHRIWLPPLPPVVELSAVVATPEDQGRNAGAQPFLEAAIGIIDRPYYQRQDPLVVDLAAEGGHLAICGGPQSGKSMALRSVVAALAVVNKPAHVRFYVIDLGGGQLTALARLPHVAGVASRDEPEKVRRIVDEVAGHIRRPSEPHTFLVIDGWHHIGTAGAEYEDLAEPVTAIVADGASARVHVVVTTNRWTSMRPNVRDLISQRLELRLGEAMDSLIDRKAQQKLPAAPGRGLTVGGEHMLIAATANQDLAHVARIHADSEPVPALKMLPDVLREVESVEGTSGITWGIGGPDLEPLAWDPTATPHVVCVGSQGSGKSAFLSTVLQGIEKLSRKEARIVVIDHRRAHLGTLEPDMVAAYAANTAATQQTIIDTVRTLEARLPSADVTPAELAARSWWQGPDIYLAIDDLDLVSEIALAPLLELLPHARDIGLHLLIARKSGGIGRALYSQFLSAVRDLQPAVFLLDSDREEGTIFGLKPAAQPPGRGQWSIRGALVGVAQSLHTESTQENFS